VLAQVRGLEPLATPLKPVNKDTSSMNSHKSPCIGDDTSILQRYLRYTAPCVVSLQNYSIRSRGCVGMYRQIC
jgi:hypothetical protein